MIACRENSYTTSGVYTQYAIPKLVSLRSDILLKINSAIKELFSSLKDGEWMTNIERIHLLQKDIKRINTELFKRQEKAFSNFIEGKKKGTWFFTNAIVWILAGITLSATSNRTVGTQECHPCYEFDVIPAVLCMTVAIVNIIISTCILKNAKPPHSELNHLNDLSTLKYLHMNFKSLVETLRYFPNCKSKKNFMRITDFVLKKVHDLNNTYGTYLPDKEIWLVAFGRLEKQLAVKRAWNPSDSEFLSVDTETDTDETEPTTSESEFDEVSDYESHSPENRKMEQTA